MGLKLLWTGLTFLSASMVLHFIPDVAIVGAIIMVIGLILFWFDK